MLFFLLSQVPIRHWEDPIRVIGGQFWIDKDSVATKLISAFCHLCNLVPIRIDGQLITNRLDPQYVSLVGTCQNIIARRPADQLLRGEGVGAIQAEDPVLTITRECHCITISLARQVCRATEDQTIGVLS